VTTGLDVQLEAWLRLVIFESVVDRRNHTSQAHVWAHHSATPLSERDSRAQYLHGQCQCSDTSPAAPPHCWCQWAARRGCQMSRPSPGRGARTPACNRRTGPRAAGRRIAAAVYTWRNTHCNLGVHRRQLRWSGGAIVVHRLCKHCHGARAHTRSAPRTGARPFKAYARVRTSAHGVRTSRRQHKRASGV
jgi:hypothetical protein